MGIFGNTTSTCCLWLGLWVLGFAELIFAALRLYYEYSDKYCNVDNPTDYCPYELMISASFAISGLIKILGLAPKAHNSKCWTCTFMILQKVALAISIAAPIGYSMVDGFKDLDTKVQLDQLKWGGLSAVNNVTSHLTH